MKTIIIILLSLVLGTSLLEAVAFSKDVKSKTTKINITAEKPLSIGSNTLVFNITQKDKVPLDTKVSVKAFMPAMPGMPAMEFKADAKNLEDGKYEVKVNFAMSGTWQLHIFIMPKQGKKYRIKTSLNF